MRSRSLVLVLAVAATLALAGCFGGDDAPATGEEPVPSPTDDSGSDLPVEPPVPLPEPPVPVPEPPVPVPEPPQPLLVIMDCPAPPATIGLGVAALAYKVTLCV